MKYISITEIEKQVFDLASKIDAPEILLPTFGKMTMVHDLK